MHTHTTSFATLEIDPRAFDDIKRRLKEAGALWDYLDTDEGREMIKFGSVALVEEPECCPLCRLHYAVEEFGRALDWCKAHRVSWPKMVWEMVRVLRKKDTR